MGTGVAVRYPSLPCKGKPLMAVVTVQGAPRVLFLIVFVAVIWSHDVSCSFIFLSTVSGAGGRLLVWMDQDLLWAVQIMREP